MLNIASINVNGIANKIKSCNIFKLLEVSKHNIFLLQETHLEHLEEWNGRAFTSFVILFSWYSNYFMYIKVTMAELALMGLILNAIRSPSSVFMHPILLSIVFFLFNNVLVSVCLFIFIDLFMH